MYKQQSRMSSARSASAHAIIPASLPSPEVRGRPMSPETALTSHPPSSTMRRPPTGHSLSVDTNLASMEKPGSSTGATGQADGTGAPEICLSPSWSDFGGSKRRKEKKRLEREKKEMDKKQKSESEQLRAAEFMVGKRLSKKPPAAMDTQKMPAALRQNSGTSFLSSRSSSRDDSRRISREEGGLSRLSIGSRGQRRSQSTPSTHAKPPPNSQESTSSTLSAAPPQLPRIRDFGWRSRRSSSGTIRTSSESVYDKDLVQFAYSLEASSDVEVPEKFNVNYTEDHQTSSQPRRKARLSFSRSKTAPNLKSAKEAHSAELSTPHPPLTPRDTDIGTFSDTQKNIHRTRRPHSPVAREDKGKQPTGKFMSDDYLQASWYAASSGHEVQPSQSKSHKDGSSYVHKQRMHQQQLSIAGYQDELAVKDANEKIIGDVSQAPDGPSLASTRSTSAESSKPHTPQTSMESEGRTDDGASSQEHVDQHYTPLKDLQYPSTAVSPQVRPSQARPLQARASQTLQAQVPSTPKVSQAQAPQAPQAPQTPQGFKADWILGFRPFQKTAKSLRALTAPRPNVSSEGSGSKLSPVERSPLSARPVQFLKKYPAKAERRVAELIHQPTSNNLPETPKSLDKDTPKENIPQRPKLETHWRRRPSSSQVLNEVASNPRSASRSSTAPVLPVIAKQISLTPGPEDGDISNEHAMHSGPSSPKRSTPRGPRSPPAGIKSLPKLPREVVVEGVNGEGLIHKTSIKRPRSNPNLLTSGSSPGTPSLDFLPELKHKPLTKPKRTSPIRSDFTNTPDKISFPASSQFPLPSSSSQFPVSSSNVNKSSSDPPVPSSSSSAFSSSAPDLKLMPRSPLRPSSETALSRPGANTRRRTMGPPGFGNPDALNAKPVAKLFVICCKCNFWHDLPSHLYELMSSPQKLSRRDNDNKNIYGSSTGGRSGEADGTGGVKEGTLATMVQCPWCQHPMTTWCCAGWTTVVYLHERHH